MDRDSSSGLPGQRDRRLPGGLAVRSVIVAAAAVSMSLVGAGVSAADEVAEASPVVEVAMEPAAEPVVTNDVLKVQSDDLRQAGPQRFATGTRIGQ